MDVRNYRIVDADYAIIGVHSDIGSFARNATNALRIQGVRAGVVILPDFDYASKTLAHLLAQVKAVGVIEYTQPHAADALAAFIEEAAQEPEWPASSFLPRVYSAVPAPGDIVPQESHLIGLVKAMREYAPNRLVLMANGMVKPALTFAENATAKRVENARATGKAFASVA